MKLLVNGEQRHLSEGATVASLVAEVTEAGMEPGGRGMAVAVDAEVVPRSSWESTALQDGQRVEILVAIQGG